MKLINFQILNFFIICFTMCSCTCCKPEDSINDTSKIRDFHKQKFSIKKDLLNNSVDLFVDYSTCLSKKETVKSIFYKAIHSKIIDCQPTFWSIKGTEIKELSKDPQQVYTLLNSINQVNYADLKGAVEKIVNRKNQAILITDGEYFQQNGNGDNYNNPYLSPSFKKWLKDGHDIYIYSEPYLENNRSPKFRYYLLFTDRDLENNLYKKLADGISLGQIKLTKLSNSDFKVYTKYNGVSQPKVNDVLSINPVNYFADINFEFQEYQIGWKDIVEFIQNATDPNTGTPIPGGDFVLRGIFVDTKKLNYFTIEELDVKVYNAYDTFRTYEDVSYASKTTDLKKIEELFTIDNDAFKKNGEIVMKIHKNFNGTGLNNEDGETCKENLLKVDIVIKKAENNFDEKNSEFDIFKFVSIDQRTNGMVNESIYQSIRNTLQDESINPQKVNNGIIYTIYIKTPISDL